MADRYAVATGNFSANATWSAVSGGAGGASAPVAGDNVILNGASGAITVTLTADASMLTFVATGFTGTLNFGGFRFTVNGATCTFASGMTLAGTTVALTTGTSGTLTLTSAGKQIPGGITVQGGGALSLADAVNATGTISPNGNFTTNNFAVTVGVFNGNTTATRTYSFGSSSIIVTTGNATVWNVPATTGLTVSANTATATFSGSNATVTGAGGINWNGMSVVYSGSGTANAMSGTFANLTRTGTASKTDLLVFNFNPTITGTIAMNGNSATNRILVQSNALGTARTITAAVVSASNVDFMDITGAGAAAWNLSAISGGSGDAGGNSGVTFTAAVTRYAVAAGNWSSTATWSAASGGAGGASVPLPQDTVVLDGNSAAGTYAVDMPRAGKDLVCTGFTRTLNIPSSAPAFYGSISLSSGMTFTGAGGFFLRGRGTHTYMSAGKQTPTQITVEAPSGTYTLADALNLTTAIVHTAGTFSSAGFGLSVGSQFISTGSLTRTVNLGSSTVTLTSAVFVAAAWQVSGSGLTVSAASSTIAIAGASSSARTFAGGGFTYGTLTYTVAASTGALAITGANTFGTISLSGGARTLTLPSGSATTVTSWNVFGTAGNLITINSSTPGTPATLVKAGGGTVIGQYLTITDIAATPASTWYAASTSVDGGGNSGWDFMTAVGSQVQTRWAVRTTVGTQRSTTWRTRAPAGRSIAVRWMTRARVAAQAAAAWNTRVTVGRSSSTRWATRISAGTQVSTQWQTRAPVGTAIATRWATRQRVSTAVATLWAVRTSVGAECATSWRTRAPAGSQVATRWYTRRCVGAQVHTTWNVRDIRHGGGVRREGIRAGRLTGSVSRTGTRAGRLTGRSST